jgi:hypothetical protein
MVIFDCGYGIDCGEMLGNQCNLSRAGAGAKMKFHRNGANELSNLTLYL